MDPTPPRETSPMRTKSPIGKQQILLQGQKTVARDRSSTPDRTHKQQWLQTEDRLFEERRAEELRKQILLKEAELAQLSQSKDRLKMRISSSLIPSQQSLEVSARLQNLDRTIGRTRTSPLRHNFAESTLKDSQIQFKRDLPSQTDFRLNKTATLAQHNNMARAGSQVQQFQYNDQIHQDNQQLQRRLNLVTAELDKVTRERNLLNQQLMSFKCEIEQYQKAIDDETRTDYHEKELQKEIFQQRDENKAVQGRLQQMEHQRLKTLSDLNRMQDDRERKIRDSEELSKGLTQKMQFAREIEDQKLVNFDRVEQLERQIKDTDWTLNDLSRQIPEQKKVVDRLRYERDELLDKSNHMNHSFDHTVQDYNRDRCQIISNHKRHVHLMASKALVKAVSSVVKTRKQQTLSQFFQYCKFDDVCHKTLTSLSIVMEKCGKTLMKHALLKWFKNGFKPTATRMQGTVLAESFYRKKLANRMFKRWYNQACQTESLFGERMKAVQQIYQLKKRDAKQEKHQAFTFWRDFTKLVQQREKSIRLIARRHQSKRLQLAFQSWLDQNNEIVYAVKHHLLAVQYSDFSLNQMAYSQMQIKVAFHKRRRLMKLAHLFKAWKDGNAYQKFMMAAEIQVQHMRREINRRLTTSIFAELRLHKEVEKYSCVHESLKNSYQPALDDLQVFMRERATSALILKKQRLLQMLDRQAKTRIASFFDHWLSVLVGSKQKILKNLKAILLRNYWTCMQRGFESMRQGRNEYVRAQLSSNLNRLQTQNMSLGRDVKKVTQTTDDETARQQRKQRQALTKAAFICLIKQLEFGIHKWYKNCATMKAKENSAKFVMEKIRARLSKQGFSIYKKKAELIKLMEQTNRKCDFYIGTRDLRYKRTIFNAVCQYTTQFRDKKRYARQMLAALDVHSKRRAIKRWNDQGNLKTVQQGKAGQCLNSIKFDELNKVLGSVTSTLEEQESLNRNEAQKLLREGRIRIANSIVRHYFTKIATAVKQWKDAVSFQNHYERVLQNMTRHITQNMNRRTQSAWCRWKSLMARNELKEMIVHTDQLSVDSTKLNTFNQTQHQNFVHARQIEISKNRQDKVPLDRRYAMLIDSFIRKNQENNYQSFLRSVFTQWRQHTRKSLEFYRAITMIISKSIWQNGLDNIRAFARDKHLTRIQNKHLKGMKQMFSRKACGQAIAIWRRFLREATLNDTKQSNLMRCQEDEKHRKFVDAVKNWTQQKGLKLLRRRELLNVWKSWCNVTLWQFSAQTSRDTYDSNVVSHKAKKVLIAWRQRIELTNRYRDRLKKFATFKQLHLKKLALRSLIQGNRQNTELCMVLHNTGRQFDNRQTEYSFRLLKFFAQSRQSANALNHKTGARALAFTLDQMLKRKMTSNLSHLRKAVAVKKERTMKFLSCFQHWNCIEMRNSFVKWANQTKKARTVEEVNETGPVVEQVYSWWQLWSLLEQFLRDQGYTGQQISQIQTYCKGLSTERLQKVVARLRHNADKENDRHLVPKVFDRWVQFCKLRKVVNRLLNDITNKLQPNKANLSIAFNRWKSSKRHVLVGIDRQVLATKAANQNRQLSQLSLLSASADEFHQQLELQRDELVGNYMRGQRMAISIAKQNKEKCAHRALSQLSSSAHEGKKHSYELILQRNIHLIEQLKGRIRDIEGDNAVLAGENEELRQFSLDGYQIAKNVQSLNEERERLSIDLADKSRTVHMLLEQNAELSSRLKDAQDNAIELINRSNWNYQRQQHGW